MSSERDLWRARCGVSRTAGSGSGSGRRAGQKACTAPWTDFHLALFEHHSYRAVWGKLTAALGPLALITPAVSSLARARRRVGALPLRRLFETLAGPVATRAQRGAFHQGLRTVALDGTSPHLPDDPQLTWRYPKRSGDKLEFGYPLLRLLVLIECGTRALLGAAFGPESQGELAYAECLLGLMDSSMLLLADAGFDAAAFAAKVSATGAQFLIRSSARRRPTCTRRLPDGSYLARLAAPYRAGAAYSLVLVRVIEANVTVTLADGTVRTEQWRLITSLTDHERHPAHELVDLYHRRWQVETTYFSVKSTMLDGRVLRSRSIDGVDQEVFALLVVYQALIRTAADAVCATTGAATMERISFTVLLERAADSVTTAQRILPGPGPADLVGTIGRAALAALLPRDRPRRVKARTRKNATSKYSANAGQQPEQAQRYTFHAEITTFETGLAPRPRR